MSFDDYLDMYSALSEEATRDVKTAYAFRIYDFDGDGVVGKCNCVNVWKGFYKNRHFHLIFLIPITITIYFLTFCIKYSSLI